MSQANGDRAGIFLCRERRLDSAEDITVLVGDEEKQFTVTKALHLQRSPSLTKALEGGFKEAIQRKVGLSEVNEESFEIYVHSIYTNSVVLLDPDKIGNDKYVGASRQSNVTVLLRKSRGFRAL